jgi:hypothetical protein
MMALERGTPFLILQRRVMYDIPTILAICG